MKITSAEFVKSAVAPEGYPVSNLPEIAFVGRSNVGKSSLINTLIQRKKLAKTSSTPGKTRLINFYLVNSKLILVDLPGYGYANAPEKVSRTWMQAVNIYFQTRNTLTGVYQLIDSRHPPTELDRRVCQWLIETKLLKGICVVKTDKISTSKVQESFNRIRELVDETYECPLIAFSSVTGRGRDELWKHILRETSLKLSAD
ncbi:MAG: ribosome biogenesis GTP-binding protein YihA/YsxC [bacterium]